MAENKKAFILYTDQKNLFDKLPDEKAGQLIKLIYEYVNDENPKIDDILLEVAFEPIKQQLKRDLEKWENRAGNSRNNGKKGGRPKKNPENPVGYSETQKNPTEPRKPVIDNVNVNVNVNVKENKYSAETLQVFNDIISSFQGLEPDSESRKNKWLDTIDKLHRLDGYEHYQIKNVINWARANDFWSSNFLSVEKLRKKDKDGVKYFKKFQTQALAEYNQQSKTENRKMVL